MFLSRLEILVAFFRQKPLFYENYTVLGQSSIGQTFTEQNFRTLQKKVSLLSPTLRNLLWKHSPLIFIFGSQP